MVLVGQDPTGSVLCVGARLNDRQRVLVLAGVSGKPMDLLLALRRALDDLHGADLGEARRLDVLRQVA